MPYRTLKPAQARELLDQKQEWVYLDVRTVEEFGQGHVPGAFNVPVVEADRSGRMSPNPAFLDTVSRRFPKTARLIVGCAAGGRSMHACELLSQSGYLELVNMHGGFLGARDPMGRVVEPGWSALGFPVEGQAPMERTYQDLRKSGT